MNMQLVQTTRDALLKPLSIVVGIVERRHTLPILANILIRKEANQVAFVATDLEVQITTQSDFGVGAENESITVSARKLLDILRALPDIGEVKFALAGTKLVVQTGKSRFSLQTLAASEYPTVSQPADWKIALTLPQKKLRHLLNMVYFSMAQQDIRYYLNGMLMVLEPGYLRAVATDGHRLAHCATAIEGITERHEVIVPRKTVLEMQRLLEDSDAPVSLEVAEGQIRFCFGNVELVSKLIEGKFPTVSRVIPTTYTRHFLVNREALQGSLQRAAILTTDKFKGVRLQLAQNLMKISSSNTEQEEAHEELDIDYGHEPLEVGFNVRYLLDVLANVKTDHVKWSVMPDQNASAVITLPDDDEFKYVVMPMRI
jgi:DNA polymerase-3 subunit beta